MRVFLYICIAFWPLLIRAFNGFAKRIVFLTGLGLSITYSVGVISTDRPVRNAMLFLFTMEIIIKKNGQPYTVLFSEESLPIVNAHRLRVSTKLYVFAEKRVNQKRYKNFLHRLIMGLDNDDDRICDHINHNTLDNRIENLRICTHRQNMQNTSSRKGSSSTYKGVAWNKTAKKWQAVIRANDINYYLGIFKTEEEAARVYDAKAVELHGEFAYLNFR